MYSRDFTKQEQIVAGCLEELGIRYEQQAPMGDLTADFFCRDLGGGTIIEADGRIGHLRKADKDRDSRLLDMPGIRHIIHIKAQKKKEIFNELQEKINIIGE